jgi:hypothetical protein
VLFSHYYFPLPGIVTLLTVTNADLRSRCTKLLSGSDHGTIHIRLPTGLVKAMLATLAAAINKRLLGTVLLRQVFVGQVIIIRLGNNDGKTRAVL